MLLPNKLSSSTLGDVFGTLHRKGISGRLLLRERPASLATGVPDRPHWIHFVDGLIVAVESDLGAPKLGAILVRSGDADARALERLSDRILCKGERRVGELLVSEGITSQAAVRAALHAQLRARVDALFSLTDATIAFHAPRPIPPSMRTEPLGPSAFLHDRPRSRDRRKNNGPPPPPPGAPTGIRAPFADPRSRAARLLGVRAEAAAEEIRSAFRKLARMLHPDTGPSSDAMERAARFAELSAAYHLLVA